MSGEARPFGVWMASALVVGGMIGSGIFVLPAQIAPFGWTGLVAWLIAGGGTVAIAMVMVDLTRLMPGEPSIISICGKAQGPAVATMLGWNYWVTVWCGNAAVATTAARYLAVVVPPIGESVTTSLLAGSAIIAVLSLVNLAGPRAVGAFQVVVTTLKILPLALVIAIIGWVMAGDGVAGARLEPVSLGSVTPALGIVYFAILGFESAVLVTERVRNPARNVSRSTLMGLAGTLLLYVVLCSGMALVAPPEELARSDAPVAWFVERTLGSAGGMVVAVAATVSCVGLINGSILYLSELPLSAVRGGSLAPWVARTNARDVAWAPLLLGSALSIALMLLSGTRSGGDVLEFMLLLTTSSSMVLYIGVVVAALLLGRARALATIGLLFAVWVVVATGVEAFLWGIGLTLLGFPLYWLAGPSATPQHAAG